MHTQIINAFVDKLPATHANHADDTILSKGPGRTGLPGLHCAAVPFVRRAERGQCTHWLRCRPIASHAALFCHWLDAEDDRAVGKTRDRIRLRAFDTNFYYSFHTQIRVRGHTAQCKDTNRLLAINKRPTKPPQPIQQNSPGKALPLWGCCRYFVWSEIEWSALSLRSTN
ncbi:unnamed protein product [Parnassius apollo]|uniref:(apollo) hypothetical protein n=1 Tax=Parnassius apollo TaxID=110799 RepID=A0A8S3VXN1_PARAO|nr:unnamed protein product [Parnassius apollo]